jgi:tripartite-type tricarboxylate transporter receptor subunit TctC
VRPGRRTIKAWGKPIVIENRRIAGGIIASQTVVNSPKDGYTLIVVASGRATNAFLYANLPYDTF